MTGRVSRVLCEWLCLSLQKHRRRGRSKLDRLGIPEEELLRQQQQLFEEARQQQLEVRVPRWHASGLSL